MAEENLGLDLASQTGQEDIAAAISGLLTALGNVTGIQGPKGDKGDTGEQGPKGDTGNTGEQGPKGDTGNGIVSVAKTGTNGNIDTYTITFSDNTTATFTVTNSNISAPASDGTYILQVSSGVINWVAVLDGDGGNY